MGPHQSKVFKKYLDGSSHTDQTSESSVYSSSLNATPKSASVTELAKTEVDKLQAKVWNPNSPDSWKADIRGYHSVQSSNYPLPSDEIEQNRLEVQHYILRVAFEGDIICPEAKELVQFDGTKVLDVGCAKGFWLESVQKENPFGEYHGVDIAENLAAEKGTINIKFGNVLERLPYEDNTFDYVHQRLLIMGMPKDRFPDAIRELIRVTKPGGWIELVEIDLVFYNAGPSGQRLSNALIGAMQARGLDCYAATNLEWYASKLAANISNQGIKGVLWPGNDETPLGKLSARNSKAGLLGLEDWMHKSLNITREEYRQLVDNCLLEYTEYKSFGISRALYFQVKKL